MQARNPVFTEATRQQISQLEDLGWYHSIELNDGRVIQGLQTLDQLRLRLAQFPIPEDLTGKRVLDIGAWDGWFSFEMERRGAQVVAVDSAKQETFLAAKELLGSRAEYLVADINKLTPADIGTFDIVLFFGVLYHTKHPMLALENVCRLSTDMAFIESYVTDDGEDLTCPPVMEFYETTELRGQFDNWVGPNTSCLMAFCRTAGFVRTKLESVMQNRAHVTCHRKWPQTPEQGKAPFLLCALNSISGSQEVTANGDDYVSLWFTSDQKELHPDNVFPQIGPFASRPVFVAATDVDGWQLNCKLPPGLEPGWHEVSLRVGESARSNIARLAVDIPDVRPASAGAARPEIRLVTDGASWDRYRIHTGRKGSLSLWVAGLPEETNAAGISVILNGVHLPASFVSCPDGEGLRQVNALLTSAMNPGEANVVVVAGDVESEPVKVELLSPDVVS